ncbi:LysR family transcriptional regulator [Pseudomonas sp. Gutcm_11s]|uniref:LysR family transcriptional regulator n=1 Tax=Pseudomonas sp. Gutcm_11s TaxID=3026088 RepID=UPI002360B8A5|nr:LysR family transcriptional regulator [Pseudomonas sp. Gutcm_11s]MDD0841264.1 LysR family transcriptional regulator [Pseudomonas sp. Gutcm_11s]
MHFDLADLRLLAAIASSGSLSKAAASIPVAVSAASTRLRLFEERCGLSLFTRTAAGMSPTPAGRLVLERARSVLSEAEQLKEALKELSGQRRITLRLSATTVANSTFLPATLGPFLADYPEVDLQLIEQKSVEVLHAVQSGDCEIGVYDGNLPTGGLLSLPFRDDKLVMLVPRDHPLANRQVTQLRDALGYPFVCLPAERAMQRFTEEMATKYAMPLQVRVRAPSFDAIAQLVAQRVGIALLPEAAASRLALELPVSLVALEDAWASRELRLCIHSWEALSPHARQLVTFLSSR